jgi:hypothetical protein
MFEVSFVALDELANMLGYHGNNPKVFLGCIFDPS